jgi:hypothetical protein
VKLTSPRLNTAFGVFFGVLLAWLAFMFATHPPHRIGPQRVVVIGSGTSMYPKYNPRTWVTARLPDGREGQFVGGRVMSMGQEICAFAVSNWGGMTISLRPLPDADCPADAAHAPLASE